MFFGGNNISQKCLNQSFCQRKENANKSDCLLLIENKFGRTK